MAVIRITTSQTRLGPTGLLLYNYFLRIFGRGSSYLPTYTIPLSNLSDLITEFKSYLLDLGFGATWPLV